MTEERKHLTVFQTPWGLYEWIRIPFALMNTAAVCLRDEICIPFHDDTNVFKSFPAHMEDVRTLLRWVRPHSLKLKSSKYELFNKQVQWGTTCQQRAARWIQQIPY